MNMKYCRFRNTRLDLLDCLNTIECGEAISGEEHDAAERMFHAVLKFCEDHDIIDGYDSIELENLLDNLCCG